MFRWVWAQAANPTISTAGNPITQQPTWPLRVVIAARSRLQSGHSQGWTAAASIRGTNPTRAVITHPAGPKDGSGPSERM